MEVNVKLTTKKRIDGNSTKEQRKFNIYIMGIPKNDRNNI